MYIRKYVIMYNKINDNVFGKTLSSVSVTIAEFAELHLPPFYSSTCRGVCTLETTAVLFSSHEDKVTTPEPPCSFLQRRCCLADVRCWDCSSTCTDRMCSRSARQGGTWSDVHLRQRRGLPHRSFFSFLSQPHLVILYFLCGGLHIARFADACISHHLRLSSHYFRQGVTKVVFTIICLSATRHQTTSRHASRFPASRRMRMSAIHTRSLPGGNACTHTHTWGTRVDLLVSVGSQSSREMTRMFGSNFQK